ncbi:MAG: TnpV protein [Oscillospiraceae bacterium]|jgi:hypothetical protein|nr:TnpV protein [Oscillospiraceae bacterium]
MELTYTLRGGYYLPDITLGDPPGAPPLGQYGRMRRAYLREHRPILYGRLLLGERLFPHLREVQAAAHERLDAIMKDILTLRPPPDKPAAGPVRAGHMAEARRVAEQAMLKEVIYA